LKKKGLPNASKYWIRNLVTLKSLFISMSVSFLLQATRILHIGNYDDNDVYMIYDFIKSVDNEQIFEYHSTSSVLSYTTDLDLFIEIIDRMLEILELVEDYEKCLVLKTKKEQCNKIKNKKTI
jgi:hypothetical protein